MATSNLGFGNADFGGSAAGFGTASPAIAPAPSASRFARLVDPQTGDYYATEDGYLTASRVAQQVALALSTRYGSIASNPTFGLRTPKKMGDGFELELESEIRRCLAHIDGARLLSVTTQRSQVAHRFLAVVRFYDASIQGENQVEIPLS